MKKINLVLVLLTCLLTLCGTEPDIDDLENVSYRFIATVGESWSYFQVGDTVDGILTYGNAVFKTNNDTITVRQDAPLANLIIHYRQKSTGKVATGKVDEGVNNTPDFTAHVRSLTRDVTSFRYVNIDMDTNDMFVESGIDFGVANFRFGKPYTSDIVDLMELEPTYLTMTIHINNNPYGPNFILDTLYKVER